MIPYIKVIKQYERIAVFTLGKYSGLMDPGLRLLFWPFHATHTVDLREEVLDIPRQTNITKDNAPIEIDFLVYMRIMENQAERAVLEVVDYYGAVVGIATTTLRAVIGEMSVDDVLSQRERINEELRFKLDEITERWGIKVTQVEIREIEPARDIQEAMNRQMSAERIRRAVVTEAEGTRQAAVTVAEGEKSAAILRAEGHRQSEILTAEGDQQAAVLRAEGLQHSAGQDSPRSGEDRLQHAQPTILRHAEVARRKLQHQVHIPDGVYPVAQPVPERGDGRRRCFRQARKRRWRRLEAQLGGV